MRTFCGPPLDQQRARRDDQTAGRAPDRPPGSTPATSSLPTAGTPDGAVPAAWDRGILNLGCTRTSDWRPIAGGFRANVEPR
jgi:hypothetical protein